MKKKYDVIVIGAGPAGSITARDLARNGYEVLQVEKRPIVGVPVRCGEATGTRQELSRYTAINEEYIESDVHGVILHHPEVSIKYDQKGVGLMLDRALFDQDLARQGKEAGVELLLDARVTNVHPYRNEGRLVDLAYEGDSMQIEGKMVVAADGVESLCGQWAGLKSRQLAPHICSAIEFQIEGTDENPNHLSFWIHEPGIPKGYIWVFPKIKNNHINLGAGTITPKAGAPNMHDVTMAFKEKYFPDRKILQIHGGSVPVSGHLEESVADGFLLVGDAAHHTNPLTGGGISASIESGDLAAKWIDKGFKNGGVHYANLRNYHIDCWNQIGITHLHQTWIREYIFGISRQRSADFWRVVKYLVDEEFTPTSKLLGYSKIGWMLLKDYKLCKKIWKTTRKRVTYKK